MANGACQSFWKRIWRMEWFKYSRDSWWFQRAGQTSCFSHSRFGYWHFIHFWWVLTLIIFCWLMTNQGFLHVWEYHQTGWVQQNDLRNRYGARPLLFGNTLLLVGGVLRGVNMKSAFLRYLRFIMRQKLWIRNICENRICFEFNNWITISFLTTGQFDKFIQNVVLIDGLFQTQRLPI